MKNMVRLFKGLLFRDRPLYVHYGITHRCNLHCRMCNIYEDVDEDGELSLSQIEKVFDILKRLGVIYVSIGGGEPFLRDDLPAVIKLLREKGFMVRLLTNGTLVDKELINDLASAGLREISISLDTLESRKFAYICNCQDAWGKVMQSIELFSSILPKRQRLLLINTVVSPLNIKELPQLCRFAERKDYYISFVPIEADGNSEFSFVKEDYKCIDESYNYLIEMKKKGKSYIFNSSLFLEKSRQYLKTEKRNWQCDAGKLYLSINPQGEVSICHKFNPETAFLNTDAEVFFKSGAFQNRRKALTAGCVGCMRPCWAEVSFLFRNRKSFLEMAKIKLSGISC